MRLREEDLGMPVLRSAAEVWYLLWYSLCVGVEQADLAETGEGV